MRNDNVVRVPLRGCTRIYLNRHGDVGAQRGLTSMSWISDENLVASWIAAPFFLLAALWWLAFGD